MTKYRQPVISRETRLLLITIVASLAALWVLARIRFQDRPPAAVTVPPVLAQLRASAAYDDLARLIAEMRPAISAVVFVPDGDAPALRIRTDAAATLRGGDQSSLAFDRATGLNIMRTAHVDIPQLVPWEPRLLDYPRYLVAAEKAGRDVALRPVFVGSLFPVTSPAWAGEVWLLPSATAVHPGTFLFTTNGVFAGVGAQENGRLAIVPGALLLKLADHLLQAPPRAAGDLGIAVQSLSPGVAAVAGAEAGVVVTTVDPNGPAAGELVPTDIVEAVNGRTVSTLEHWRVFAARLHSEEVVALRVRSKGDVRHVELIASPPPLPPPDDPSLGLRMRMIPKVGSEVLFVQPRSRAARAAIEPGDVLTVAGRHIAPTPAEVTRAFSALPENGRLLVALTRSSESRVAVVEK